MKPSGEEVAGRRLSARHLVQPAHLPPAQRPAAATCSQRAGGYGRHSPAPARRPPARPPPAARGGGRAGALSLECKCEGGGKEGGGVGGGAGGGEQLRAGGSGSGRAR